MPGLLTIETGFTCNSRCRYCTQLDYRVIPQADKLDLATDEIKERIRYAAEGGYDQVGFSGGEPTIRPDFVELIAYAKSHGFRRIGVTSNGRMFAYRSFTEAAMRAGLDGFTFSLHGSTPELHDRIANAKGALEQALAGLRNISAVRKAFGLQAHLMNNQILLPENVHEIGAMVELLAPLGVHLFMIQPFISQRSNSDEIGRFFVPYDDVVASVRAALPSLRRHKARVKPYNVPNCLLTPLGSDVVEAQFYGIKPFREYEKDAPGEFRAFKVRQWFRVDACATCKEVCPGFRVEQTPQSQLVDEVVAGARAHIAGLPTTSPQPSPIFAGTELLTPASLRAAIHGVAALGAPAAWMTGLCERSERKEIAEAVADLCEDGSLAEVVLVGSPMDQRFLAQRVLEKGNLEELRQGLALLGEVREAGRRIPRLRLLLNIGDAVRLLDDESVSLHWGPLLRGLRRASGAADGETGFADLLVAVPNFPRGQTPPDMARQAEEVRAIGKRLRAAAEIGGLRARLVTFGDIRGLDPARAAAMALAEAALGKELEQESWAERLFRHPGSMPEMDFVSWMPPWIFERFADVGAAPVEVAAADTGSAPSLRVGPAASTAMPLPSAAKRRAAERRTAERS